LFTVNKGLGENMQITVVFPRYSPGAFSPVYMGIWLELVLIPPSTGVETAIYGWKKPGRRVHSVEERGEHHIARLGPGGGPILFKPRDGVI
jgi:hypothetical protein